MILTAIEAVFVKKLILLSSISIAFISWCYFGMVFSLLLLFIYIPNIRTEIRKLKSAYLLPYLGLIACLGTMQYTSNYVFAQMDVGYALSLFQLSSIVSVVLGYKFFREADMGRKVLGAAIMIAGSVVIILLSSRL
jgi:drug/metabolite transporter (DMT)-like permease